MSAAPTPAMSSTSTPAVSAATAAGTTCQHVSRHVPQDCGEQSCTDGKDAPVHDSPSRFYLVPAAHTRI
jgi:hypothetical protein